MTYYEIKIKGMKDMLTAKKEANSLKVRWEQFMIGKEADAVVSVSGWTGTLSSIGYFKEMTNSSPASGDSVNKDWEMSHNEYLKMRDRMLKLTPEERAKDMNFFRIFYSGFTKRHSEEVKITDVLIEDYVMKIQKDFFEKNPKRILCDPDLFKVLIKSKECHPSVLNMTVGAVQQDIKLSK